MAGWNLKKDKKREVAWEKKFFFSHLIACQHLCVDWGEAGQQWSLWVAVGRVFCWLASSCVSLWSRPSTFLPLIAADETLMLPPSSQHLARAHPSDPSHSNVLRPTPPNPPDCCKQNSRVWPAFVLCCLHRQPEWMCFPMLMSSCPFSDQGEGDQPGGGRRRQRRLREPNQEDQVWHQADQGVCVCVTVFTMQEWKLKDQPRNSVFVCFSDQMFKGPDQDIEAIYTAPSSAQCGVTLETNSKDYLITGAPLCSKSTLCWKIFTLASNTRWLLLPSSPWRQTGGWRDGAHHTLQLHHGLGVHKCHPEEEPDSALRNGLWLQGKVPSVATSKLWFLPFSNVNPNSYNYSLVFRSLAARPSRAPSPGRRSACGWTGWSRGQLTDSRLSTLRASRGTMTLVPGTEGRRHPKGISLTSKTRNSTITKECEAVEMYWVQNRTKKNHKAFSVFHLLRKPQGIELCVSLK